VDGATGRGIPEAKAIEVFELMAKFADYGFNKSHAAAYALVAYQTAWMKTNHPVEFLAACMSLAINNTDKLAALRQEAERLGIRVLPPDINRSAADFKPDVDATGKPAIRYALAAVKKVGMAAMQALVAARGDRPFRDVTDLASRVDPRQLNKMQIENLVRAGALDGIAANRAQLFAGAELLLRRAQADAEQKESGQIGLFGGAAPEPIRLPATPDWPPLERLGFEAEAIGFHLTAHPLDTYAALLARIGAIGSSKLETMAAAGATRVKLAGCVIGRKERPTRSGSKMAWVRLSDAAGSYEVTFFSEALAAHGELLRDGAPILVTADLKQEGEALRITASSAISLEQAAAEAGAGIRIWLGQTAAVPHIRSILDRERKGRGRVVLLPRVGDGQDVEIELPGGFNVTPRLAQALKLIPGVEKVEEV
jgi:DNA polymerase-3 subunit alpha